MKVESIVRLSKAWMAVKNGLEVIMSRDVVVGYDWTDFDDHYLTIDLCYYAFMIELGDNAKQTSPVNLFACMSGYLSELSVWSGYNIEDRTKVIQNGICVDLCLYLMDKVDEISQRVNGLMRYDEIEQKYIRLSDPNTFKCYYSDLSEPQREKRFDFEVVKTKIAEMDDHLARISYINQVKYDFRYWQSSFKERYPGCEQGSSFYGDKYYPSLIEKCDLHIKFLMDELETEKLRYSISASKAMQQDLAEMESGLTWDAPDTHLLELAKALYETGVVKRKDGEKLTQQAFFDLFGGFFNLELKNIAKKLNSAANRKKERTPFLDRLKNAFESYCNRILEK